MENAIKWKADFQRESIIKVSFIKITVISMLNFASSNIADILPIHAPFTTIIDMQISYFPDVRSDKSCF
jgi:hypothetical protein